MALTSRRLRACDPKCTLFIIVSKTFANRESLIEADQIEEQYQCKVRNAFCHPPPCACNKSIVDTSCAHGSPTPNFSRGRRSLEENLPVLLAVIELWYNDFYGSQTYMTCSTPQPLINNPALSTRSS
ncbi:hypothetical protein HETIRDRAFT_108750 [Heterobasidion irregulare TC 32-1]|uniref:Uncharacterized protein n=1 Tax=Heterobasidion irregulare (strain TC 32-1) TaxID=747525 RepID=W4KBN3_HETIT|nr:uncharacterized protein HETIRDRAFT_108750 [Heterobasidion irregulare TC 32-1]ETW82476.1 hypothetical protein HETIRDRAFT_108750 [Heterobasidion irregulare TC 32-1]